jgi:urease accessory protein
MLRAASTAESGPVPFDIVVLAHDERHLRRRLLTLQHGDEVLVDLPQAVTLTHGTRLVLGDGRHVEVIAAQEELIEVRARDAAGLLEIAWHLGNRHTPAQIEADRILVAQDHVLADMLRGLGAEVRPVSEPFEPVRGAYHRHEGAHGHHHHQAHDHG